MKEIVNIKCINVCKPITKKEATELYKFMNKSTDSLYLFFRYIIALPWMVLIMYRLIFSGETLFYLIIDVACLLVIIRFYFIKNTNILSFVLMSSNQTTKGCESYYESLNIYFYEDYFEMVFDKDKKRIIRENGKISLICVFNNWVYMDGIIINVHDISNFEDIDKIEALLNTKGKKRFIKNI